MSWWNRLRANTSDLALLCALTLIGAVLITAVPRYTDHLAVQALTADIDRAGSGARDLTLSTVGTAAEGAGGPAALGAYRALLPGVLPGAVADGWFAAASRPGTTIVPSGPETRLRLRTQTGLTDATTLVAGTWPATASQPGAPVQIVLSTQIAGMFGVRVGEDLAFGSFTVRITGLFEPRDPDAPFWADVPSGARVVWPQEDDPFEGVAFTDQAGLAVAAAQLGDVTLTWRYRFDPHRLSAPPVEETIAAVVQARRVPYGEGIRVITGLDELLQHYADQVRATRSLLAVVQLGLLAPLLGATVLAARLAAERRRQEYALLRARGAGAAMVGLRTLAESAAAVPPAALAGWSIGSLVPGRAAGTGWSVLAVAAVALLTAPLLAVLAVRHTALTTSRRDMAGTRPSASRLTAELCVVVFAVLGVYLLRRRGLGAQGVDVFLAAVPVLLAVGAALLALRVLPVPLGWAARLAARTRGVVVFLGLNRVARSAGVNGAPLAVLVVAVTTGLFTGAIATSIDDARDRASDAEIGADARLQGTAFALDTVQRLAAVPGVDAVAPAAIEWSATVGTGSRSTSVPSLVVDAPAYQRVLDRGAVHADLPPELLRARPAGTAVPVVVSPAVAAELGGPGTATVMTVRGRPYEVIVGGVVDTFPGFGAQTRRFVVLPWQALPADAPVVPNRLLIAGTGADAGALRAVGDEGQNAYVRATRGTPRAGLDFPSELLTWSSHRAALDATGANGVLSFVFTVGVAGSAALALLAVGFAVLIGAVPRGQVLSRLRTMGLAARTGRRLLVVELAPLVGLAAVVGATLGIVLPALLRPALDLTVLTAGLPARTRVEPLLVGGVLTLVVVALAVAVIVESTVNHRLRLGEALRIAEER